MKNLFVTLVAFATCIAVSAQTASRALDYETSGSDIEKLTRYQKTLYDIHIKAVRSFKRSYQHIQHETWFTIPNGYRARFVDDSIAYTITYDKKGNWLYTIKQYNEAQFARELRAQVKTVYYDYTITLVEEIERPMKSPVYVVHMEDRYTLKNIQLCDREMETVLDVKKSGPGNKR